MIGRERFRCKKVPEIFLLPTFFLLISFFPFIKLEPKERFPQ